MNRSKITQQFLDIRRYVLIGILVFGICAGLSTFSSAIAQTTPDHTEGWIMVWTEEAIPLPPGEAPVQCVENLSALRLDGQGSNRFEIEVCFLESGEGPEYAFYDGSYTTSTTPLVGTESAKIAGRYISILSHLEDGSWQPYQDAENSNLALATAMGTD